MNILCWLHVLTSANIKLVFKLCIPCSHSVASNTLCNFKVIHEPSVARVYILKLEILTGWLLACFTATLAALLLRVSPYLLEVSDHLCVVLCTCLTSGAACVLLMQCQAKVVAWFWLVSLNRNWTRVAQCGSISLTTVLSLCDHN